ncbi:Inner membrane protein YnjF [Vibrio stylophorae]|uniref:Inner membrane protein YnjF n=1 Tax=Vibrio stylophorae TaxID=659351 RepID=A0ABM8ZSD3_9VIBR|nr:CDP-alcohol phosphatidyltransferase family protein [Vibrio stylophorae]CAH0533041.1 Inner membrane protein YnjF [Vibrio stylophorae]
MLDPWFIQRLKRPLQNLSAWCDQPWLSANRITVTGFIVGLCALPLLTFELYTWALLAIVINRLFDGLDGALARRRGTTDAGGFLDIALDFLFYALVPFGFALANPTSNALAAAFILFAFIGTGTSFLAFAIMAAKRNIQSPVYPHKSLYYLGGLTEGSETIAFFVLCCLMPQYFARLAYLFGALCWLTTATRIILGYRTLKTDKSVNLS